MATRPGDDAAAHGGGDAPSATRITYVPDSFPTLSESFVINEIYLLMKRGYVIQVEPMREGLPEVRMHGRLLEMRDVLGVGKPSGRLSLAGLPTALRRASQYWPGLRPAGLRKQLKSALAVTELVARIKASRPDVIVNHFGFDNAVASAIAARRLRVPLILWIHGNDFYSHPHRNLPWIADHCAIVIVTTPWAESELRKLGVRCEILPSNMGVNLEHFHPGSPADRSAVPTLATIARLGHNKNHERMLRVFAGVRRHCPETVLWLVGSGPKRAQLEAMAADLGLHDAVEFRGGLHAEQLPSLLRRAWLKMLLSDKEGLGVVLMEAAACGLPAVASRVGGVPEVIADGETGLLFDFDAPDAEEHAARAIADLLRDDVRRGQMGRAARERAERLFDERKHADRLDGLIRKLTD